MCIWCLEVFDKYGGKKYFPYYMFRFWLSLMPHCFCLKFSFFFFVLFLSLSFFLLLTLHMFISAILLSDWDSKSGRKFTCLTPFRSYVYSHCLRMCCARAFFIPLICSHWYFVVLFLCVWTAHYILVLQFRRKWDQIK